MQGPGSWWLLQAAAMRQRLVKLSRVMSPCGHSWSQTFTLQYQLGFRKCSEMVVTSVELHQQGRGSASQLAGGFPTVRLSAGPGTICPQQPPASPGHPSAGSWCSPGTKETTASAMVWGMKVAARPHLHGAECS